MGIDSFDNKLTTFLFSKTRRSLLALLYGRPDETFYINQLMQATGAGSGAVQRELKLMTEASVLIRRQSGNLVYYQANPGSPIFEELRSIITKTFGVADVIRQSLSSYAAKIRVAFIFGSVARSADGKASDIDIMVIGDVSFGEVSSAISQAEKTIRREINPVVYPVKEFRQKLKEKNHFLKTVLDGEKIFLIGDELEPGRLAE